MSEITHTEENEVGGWVTTSDPASATREVPFMNSMHMLFVPIARFQTLFCIVPVRVCDYAIYCEVNGYLAPSCDFPQAEDHPQTNVTWEEASRYCDWLTARDLEAGWLGQDFMYRLPIDTEWSAAVGLPNEPHPTPKARSGMADGYPWGNSFPPPRGAGNYHESLRVDDFPETSPVASFPPNQFGLYDMGGNVWEWCQDAFDTGKDLRVVRGACCFNNGEDFMRSSHRGHLGQKKRSHHTGFRVALSGKLSRDPLHRLAINPWR